MEKESKVDRAPSRLAADRLEALDWTGLVAGVDGRGFAVVEGLLCAEECRSLASVYDDDSLFRRRVVMAQHGYGQGEYKYFAAPLPALIEDLRIGFYAHLAPIANEWNERLGTDTRYPATQGEFVRMCHAAGQQRPTPLLLRYEAGDYNCLHQDLYGPLAFPFQVAILLSEPGVDFTGGEFVLLESRLRRQSVVEVVPLSRGDGVIFAVHHRPVVGLRGTTRATMKHGVSRLRSGKRYVAGVIFHDAT